MKHSVLPIVLVTLIVRSCAAAIVVKPPEPEGRTLLYEAAVDILMTCYGNSGKAVGILGDSDGSFLKTLWSNYVISAVLLDANVIPVRPSTASAYELQVFVIVTNSPQQLIRLINILGISIWWNENAKLLIVNTAPDAKYLLSRLFAYMYITSKSGLLNVQCVSLTHLRRVYIFDSNPFIRNAPEAWRFIREVQLMKDEPPMSLFEQMYKNEGKTCMDLHFPKTNDVGGYPLYFLIERPRGQPIFVLKHILGAQTFELLLKNPVQDGYKESHIIEKTLKNPVQDGYTESHIMDKMGKATTNHYYWFIENMMIAVNASAVITNDATTQATISLNPHPFSNEPQYVGENTNKIIMSRDQWRFIAVTNHTGHKSQLKKILSIIDTPSQIGMCIVYLITFFFFKFFLGQTVMPALLNIVRLTCNTGLLRLPQNLAPTIYLVCLLMFVVTLQGIFTGNLATLLTTTISYPNVETKGDIPKLGYKLYIRKELMSKLTGDPSLDGHIIEIPRSEMCPEYLLTDPLAVCVIDYHRAITYAVQWNLHLSTESIVNEYLCYQIGSYNPFKRRLQQIMTTWTETGLRHEDPIWESLHRKYVVDDDVRSNVERRVMTLGDLGFAFVILGVGLILSSICLIGEIVHCRIRLKIARRRNRVRPRLAWEFTKKKFSLYPSLNLAFNARRLLSKRRQAFGR